MIASGFARVTELCDRRTVPVSHVPTGKKKSVSRFHSALSTYISTFEVEHMQEQERYLLEMLME